MKIIKLNKINNEKEKWFEKRTNKHIDLVKKYCKKIYDYDKKFYELLEICENHDASKFKEPEKTPYILITWKYKCINDNEPFSCSKKEEKEMNDATEYHIKNNSHHPEYYSEQKENLINKNNRDEKPKNIIDATKMPDISIAEMVADWCAVSEERNSSPEIWAKNNINKRWKFTKEQENLIYNLIKNIYE